MTPRYAAMFRRLLTLENEMRRTESVKEVDAALQILVAFEIIYAPFTWYFM